MRVFFALQPDPTLRQALSSIAKRLHAECGGRRMRDDSLHLTLAFIGDVSEAQAEQLIALCQGLDCPTGEWPLDRVGYFPRGGVAWLGSQATPEPLDTLHTRLWYALAGEGFTPPDQPFVPHVTLLRRARPPHSEAIPGPSLTWRYNRVTLIHSVPDGAGRRYDPLAHSPAV